MDLNIKNIAVRALAVAAVAGAMTAGVGAAEARDNVYIGAHFGGGYYARPHYWYGGPRLSVGFGVGPYWDGYYAPYYYPYSYYRSPVVYGDVYDDRPYDRSAGVLASPYVQQALVAPVGESVTWARGGAIGRVTTTRDGWAGEKYCREFVENVTVNDNTHETKGTACQSEGSAWRLVANQP